MWVTDSLGDLAVYLWSKVADINVTIHFPKEKKMDNTFQALFTMHLVSVKRSNAVDHHNFSKH